MNIFMMTNTYKPIIGGLERSIELSARAYRKRGHRVIIVAPEYKGQPEEEDVIRLPAIQKFSGTDFSVQLPIPGVLDARLKKIKPDVVHSHHPFLIGDTAARVSGRFNTPLIFTFHTLYERYTHYVPLDSDNLKKFVISLSVGYANLCDEVFAPTKSVASLLKERGVKTNIEVVPTGIKLDDFGGGDRQSYRNKLNLKDDDFLIGFVSRLEPEKNIMFLAEAAATFLKMDEKAHFLVVGKGSQAAKIKELFKEKQLHERLHLTGVLKGKELLDSYYAMDVFAFASKTETQGLVLLEAMACGVPVIALRATGAEDIVQDRKNGRLIPDEKKQSFVDAFLWLSEATADTIESLKEEAKKTAEEFSHKKCVDKALSRYEAVLGGSCCPKDIEKSSWRKTMKLIKKEWEIVSNMARATQEALGNSAK